MNPLYKELSQNAGQTIPVLPQNNVLQQMYQLASFIRTNYGANATPEQVARSMLANGQISKESFEQACSMANMLTGRKY